MTLSEIIASLTKLSAAIQPDEFIYDFLTTFGTPKATISRLKSGDLNLAKKDGCTLLKAKVYFEPLLPDLLKSYTPAEAIQSAQRTRQIMGNKPRFLIATDFQNLAAFDTRKNETVTFPIAELHDHYAFFLPLAGMERTVFQAETEADVKAAEHMAKLYDLIRADNPPKSREQRHALNVFLTRLLFCYFAEDTGIYPEQAFTEAIDAYTQVDGSDVAEFLRELFLTLNTEPKARHQTKPHFKVFPYVNGGLFTDTHARCADVPVFSTKSRARLIDLGTKSWKEINPDIFGSMFQGVVDDEKRAELGMHYTSVPNIMKVIRPLFLDELYEEFEKAKGSVARLNKLLNRIYRLRIFDPACGSGNFLIIAYKELRRLEMLIFKELEKAENRPLVEEPQPGFEGKGFHAANEQPALKVSQATMRLPGIHVSQFYGIELDDFAHEVAILALWLAEHQMNVEFRTAFGNAPASLPLKDGAKIVCGNATRIDWNEVCPKDAEHEVFVMGNPPYSGSRKQNKAQKEDMALVFKERDGYKNIDFIACWFEIAGNYIRGNKSRAAFVSTNSICQGVQTAIIWPEILAKGIEIKFAYAPFKWGNNAKANAGVTCVIIGLGTKEPCVKKLFYEEISRVVPNINPYLTPGSNTIVHRRSSTISKLPPMFFGNMPNDGGNLIFDEKPANLFPDDLAFGERIVRRFIGADEFLYGRNRYCLWIKDNQLEKARSNREVQKRLLAVTKHRQNSTEPSTREKANTPHQFYFNRHTDSPLILFPSTTSESRVYIPVGMFFDNPIISNSAMVVYEAEPWVFAVVSSKIHMIWTRAVAGGLETRIRYSSSICYNTFPFPEISDEQKKELSAHAEKILSQREQHPEKTIADIYDSDEMPPDLLAAHRALDVAVEKCYREKRFAHDEERLEYLFTLYEQMTAAGQAELLAAEPVKKAKPQRKKTHA
jgi:hypothetical protein